MQAPSLSILILLLTGASAFACPGCKEAVGGAGGFWASGFNCSIVFMLAVFCTLLGTVCYKVFRIIQNETAATARDPEAVHASNGRWMTVTLPVCVVGIAVLMVLGSTRAESASSAYASENAAQAEIAAAQGDLLITFKSETCEICQKMKPTMENLGAAFSSKIKMLYVKTTESKTLVRDFNIDSLPCSVLIHNGKEVARREGLYSETEFKSWLNEQLK